MKWLLLETDLTLQKTINIASQIESAIAEAKARTPVTEATVKVVQPSGGATHPSSKQMQLKISQQQLTLSTLPNRRAVSIVDPIHI